MSISYSKFANRMIENGIVTGLPVSGMFELTSRCNLKCKMCYVCNMGDYSSLMKRELTAKEWIRIGEEARDAGLLMLTLTGGEIFIRNDFFEIYEAYKQMGLVITLFTNSTLLDEDKINRLAKNPPLKISITVYGASPDTYGKVTGHAEAYQKTIDNIKALISAGIKVHLKTTVIKHNKDDFQKLAEFADSLGLNMGLVNYVSPRRDGNDTDPLANRLSPIELVMYEKNADNCIAAIGKAKKSKEPASVILVNDVMAEDELEAIHKAMEASNAKKTAFKCTAGKCAFWLSWEGKMYTCGLLSEPYTEPLKLGFTRAWEELKELCYKIPSCSECESCSYYSKCMVCPARLKTETGRFDRHASYLCEYTRARDEVFSSDRL